MKRKYSNKYLFNKGQGKQEKKVKVLVVGKGRNKALKAAIKSAILVSGIANYGNMKEKEDVK